LSGAHHARGPRTDNDHVVAIQPQFSRQFQ
jgi:hypothetical protein